MKKISTQESNKSIALTESKALRDDAIEGIEFDFLDKFRIIPYLTDDMVVSVEQASRFYDASKKSVETIISRNREEFEDDGMVVLTGEDFKQFLANFSDLQTEGAKTYDKKPDARAHSITLLPKRSLLRIGMIMTNNAMARKVRDYLLNVEQEHASNRKSWIIQREVGIIERKKCMSAVSRYVPNGPYKQFAYPNYTNMIYRSIFGCTAKELKDQRNSDDLHLRDHFSKEELEKVEEAEVIVRGLLSIGFSYKEIEEALLNKFKPKLEDKKCKKNI